MKAKFVAAQILLFATIVLSGCSGGGHAGTGPSTYVPPNSQKPGTIATLDVYQYDPPVASLPNRKAPLSFARGLQNQGWTVVEDQSNADVGTGSFVNVFGRADAIFFAGHGDAGLFAFTHLNQPNYLTTQWGWGPGPTAGGGQFNNSGMPVNNRTHWIFALSSDTVAGSTVQDPNSPNFTTNWNPAFGGSLHGLYGFWQAPGYCYSPTQPANNSRSCDVTTRSDATVGTLLPLYLYGPFARAQYVHDAWIHTASDAGMAVGWSIWEDKASRYDVFTGPGGFQNLNPIGNRAFYYSVGTQIMLGAVNVSQDVAPLQPRYPIPESISDQTLINTYQPYVSTITSVSDGVNVDSVTADGLHARHNQATGAISYHGLSQDNPVAFTQDVALQAATAFVQNSLGMPPDAVLQAVDLHRQYDPDSGSDILIGYEFVWSHNTSGGQPIVGDAIRVIVNDDLQQGRGICNNYEYSEPDERGRVYRYCTDWTYTYTDIPDISYAMRMWHGLSSGGGYRQVQSAGRSTGGTSIDAYTASLSLPANSIITSYAYGFWNGTFDGTSGGSAGQPAWIFTLGNGNIVAAVDAFSGEVLGQVSQ